MTSTTTIDAPSHEIIEPILDTGDVEDVQNLLVDFLLNENSSDKLDSCMQKVMSQLDGGSITTIISALNDAAAMMEGEYFTNVSVIPAYRHDPIEHGESPLTDEYNDARSYLSRLKSFLKLRVVDARRKVMSEYDIKTIVGNAAFCPLKNDTVVKDDGGEIIYCSNSFSNLSHRADNNIVPTVRLSKTSMSKGKFVRVNETESTFNNEVKIRINVVRERLNLGLHASSKVSDADAPKIMGALSRHTSHTMYATVRRRICGTDNDEMIGSIYLTGALDRFRCIVRVSVPNATRYIPPSMRTESLIDEVVVELEAIMTVVDTRALSFNVSGTPVGHFLFGNDNPEAAANLMSSHGFRKIREGRDESALNRAFLLTDQWTGFGAKYLRGKDFGESGTASSPHQRYNRMRYGFDFREIETSQMESYKIRAFNEAVSVFCRTIGCSVFMLNNAIRNLCTDSVLVVEFDRIRVLDDGNVHRAINSDMSGYSTFTTETAAKRIIMSLLFKVMMGVQNDNPGSVLRNYISASDLFYSMMPISLRGSNIYMFRAPQIVLKKMFGHEKEVYRQDAEFGRYFPTFINSLASSIERFAMPVLTSLIVRDVAAIDPVLHDCKIVVMAQGVSLGLDPIVKACIKTLHDTPNVRDEPYIVYFQNVLMCVMANKIAGGPKGAVIFSYNARPSHVVKPYKNVSDTIRTPNHSDNQLPTLVTDYLGIFQEDRETV